MISSSGCPDFCAATGQTALTAEPPKDAGQIVAARRRMLAGRRGQTGLPTDMYPTHRLWRRVRFARASGMRPKARPFPALRLIRDSGQVLAQQVSGIGMPNRGRFREETARHLGVLWCVERTKVPNGYSEQPLSIAELSLCRLPESRKRTLQIVGRQRLVDRPANSMAVIGGDGKRRGPVSIVRRAAHPEPSQSEIARKNRPGIVPGAHEGLGQWVAVPRSAAHPLACLSVVSRHAFPNTQFDTQLHLKMGNPGTCAASQPCAPAPHVPVEVGQVHLAHIRRLSSEGAGGTFTPAQLMSIELGSGWARDKADPQQRERGPATGYAVNNAPPPSCIGQTCTYFPILFLMT